MRWSLGLGRIAGIRIYVHFTFFLLLAWIAFSDWATQGGSLWQSLSGLILFLCLSVIIVLHELGHALAAKQYGIQTRDITLLPIGGVARLERMPEKPLQELVVALAGPAVNVVLAAILFFPLALGSGVAGPDVLFAPGGNLVSKLLWVNVFLVGFNMLPAFPMDGGRVLRAFLALGMEYVQATRIAATIGQMMAVLFGVFGLFSGNLFLMLIALFVWLGAEAEANMVQAKSVLAGVPVSRVMATQVQALTPTDTLGHAASFAVHGFQHDFPVIEDGRVVGMLTHEDLLTALAEKQPDIPVGDVMETEFKPVHPFDTVETALQRLHDTECPALPVIANGKWVGIVTAAQVGEYLILRESVRKRPVRRDNHEAASDEPARQDEQVVV